MALTSFWVEGIGQVWIKRILSFDRESFRTQF
jgi:hypothetical protein